MDRFNAIFFSFLFVLFSMTLSGLSYATGTIIVTYQTDQNSRQLDHIRFWLINEKQERFLYPKKEGFVSNPHAKNQRTVVISKLPEGKYGIEFLVPRQGQNFEKIPPRIIEVTNDAVVKVNQEIKLISNPHAPVVKATETQPKITELTRTLDLADAYIQSVLTPLPPPNSFVRGNAALSNPILASESGYLTVNTNKTVSWKLMNNGHVLYTSQGSIANLRLRPARNYYIIAEEIPGYSLRITPNNPFDIPPEAAVNAEILYQRDSGFVDIEATLPSVDESLSIVLYPQQESLPPLKANLIPVDGKIVWSSGPIPTGEYIITYKLPDSYIPINNQHLFIEKGLHTFISPKFNSKGSLHVITNSTQASYILTAENGTLVGHGQGTNFLFKGLDAGYYEVTFSSNDTKLFVPPPLQKVFIPLGQSEKINVNYTKQGSLNLSASSDNFTLNIKLIESGEIIKTVVSGRSQQLYLPEGKYTLFSDPSDSHRLQPVDVNIKATSPQNVYLSFEKLDKEIIPSTPSSQESKNPANHPENIQSGLDIHSNLLDIYLTLEEKDRPHTAKSFMGKDKKLFIPLSEEGTYTLTFASIPHYDIPKSQQIEYKKGDHLIIQVLYELGHSLLEVPAGMAIVGDPFADNEQNERYAVQVFIPPFEISAFLVTNEQFAQWLNDAFKQGSLRLDNEHPGHILNTDGMLVCRTKEANPLAQITFRKKSGSRVYLPVAGKEAYPVIEVTWYGAEEYCKDNGLRLPSERQWEKAAGMAISLPDEPLKRYKYGFGQDTIDRSWANYRTTIQAQKTVQVLTSPVGFYNGRNSLPLTLRDKNQTFTKNAQSPIGAYDMSGNVWEWTSSWNELEKNDIHKIAKGGCYDSFEEGVRVSERLPMTPDYADIYTGFRVAKYVRHIISTM